MSNKRVSNTGKASYSKMYEVVVEDDGRVVALSPLSAENITTNSSPDTASTRQWATGMNALPHQKLYKVEMPAEFAGLKTAMEKYDWLKRHRFETQPQPHFKPLEKQV